MSFLFQIVVSFIVCFGISLTWPVLIERQSPLAVVHASVQEDFGSSIFNDIDRIMANMNQQVEQFLNWPTFSMNVHDDAFDLEDEHDRLSLSDNFIQLPVVNEVESVDKQLAAVEPVCTTITDTPTTISPRKSRRRKLPITKTTTCVRELVLHGQRYFSEEIITTDQNDVVIKQSQHSGSTPVETRRSQTKVFV